MTLPDLIAALERAEGPSRELDRAIYRFVCTLPDWLTDPAPYYTASVDDALLLYIRKPAWISTNPLEVCMDALVQIRDDAALKARA